MPDIDHLLIPRVARDWHVGPKILKHVEKILLREFQVRGVAHLSSRPASDWEWLALAQHYGLPTRLLDWTRNPLVALYFACSGVTGKDGGVYFAKRLDEVDIQKNPSSFEVSEVKAWSVHQIDVRLAAQDGLFTIGPDPTCPLEKGVRLRAVVKAAAKPQVLNLLAKFGVHPGTIFPGLEGAAKYVESQYFFFRGLPDLDALEAEMKKFPDDDNG